MELKSSDKSSMTITPEAFDEMIRIRDELDGIIETIEIMNDEELMEGIRRSKEDIEAGRTYELKNVNDLEQENLLDNAD